MAMAEGEKAVDRYRETVAEIGEYEPWAAFKRLAAGNGESIGTADLMYFLEENGVKEVSMFELGAMLT